MTDGVACLLANTNPLLMRISLGLRRAAVMATLVLSSRAIIAQSVTTPAPAVDSVRLRLARDVIHASGADSAAARAIQTMVTAQSASLQNSNVPPGFWEKFLAHAHRDIPLLVDSLVPLYASHFSVAELTQLKAFFTSPIGQRLVAEQGPLQQEGARLGMRWGAKIGSEVAMELMDESMEKPESPQQR